MSDEIRCDGMPCVGTSYVRLLTAERDSARSIAVRLEQECAGLVEFLVGTGACSTPTGLGLARAARTPDEVLDYVRDALGHRHADGTPRLEEAP